MVKQLPYKKFILPLVSAAIVLELSVVPVYAQYTSPDYKVNEVQFGAGSENDLQSSDYRAHASAGALGVGSSSSADYQAYSGFLTPNEPFLEMGIDTSNVNLGQLSTASTNTGTATFHVRAYLNSGYTVQTVSQAPTLVSTNSHTLAPMTAAAGPTIGKEEFGINLVANTAPAVLGANPSPQPSGSFASGQAAAGYNSANNYKYNAGDTIAQTSTSGWGLTIYTISYVADISVLTPAGNYIMNHDLVAVGTY